MTEIIGLILVTGLGFVLNGFIGILIISKLNHILDAIIERGYDDAT